MMGATSIRVQVQVVHSLKLSTLLACDLQMYISKYFHLPLIKRFKHIFLCTTIFCLCRYIYLCKVWGKDLWRVNQKYFNGDRSSRIPCSKISVQMCYHRSVALSNTTRLIPLNILTFLWRIFTQYNEEVRSLWELLLYYCNSKHLLTQSPVTSVFSYLK